MFFFYLKLPQFIALWCQQFAQFFALYKSWNTADAPQSQHMTAVVTRQQQPKRICHTDTMVTLSSVWSLTDRDVSSRSIRRCVFIRPCLLLNPAEMKRRASSPEGWRWSRPPPCNACSHHQLQWEEWHVFPPVDWPGAGDLRFHIRKTWEDWRSRCWKWKQCRRGFLSDGF